MEFRKALFNAASVLALTAASQGSASASVSDIAPNAKVAIGYQQVDPLLLLMQATEGSIDIEVVVDALGRVFGNASPADVQAIPGLVTGLATMGVPAAELGRAKAALKDIVTASPAISEDVREQVLAQLGIDVGRYKLAAELGQVKIAQEQRRRRRDPNELGQVPRDPSQVGQVAPVPAS